MITVTNPSGTPSVIYNRDGTTIVSVTASSGNGPSIPRYSGTTVAVVSTTTGGWGVTLPSTSEVGDVVEVYLANSASSIYLYPNSGGTINALSADAGLQFTKAICRCVAANTWFAVSTL